MKKWIEEDWEGSFKARGSDKDYEIEFGCADGLVRFRLSARKRDT